MVTDQRPPQQPPPQHPPPAVGAASGLDIVPPATPIAANVESSLLARAPQVGQSTARSPSAKATSFSNNWAQSGHRYS
jgi:hypothetical protein